MLSCAYRHADAAVAAGIATAVSHEDAALPHLGNKFPM